MSKHYSWGTILYLASIVFITILSFTISIFLIVNSFDLSIWIRPLLSALFMILSILLLVFFVSKTVALTKLLLISNILMILFAVIYYLLWANNLIVYMNSVESIKELIISTGIWGQLVFTLIQFLQVVILPIPAIISTLAGVAIFGPFISFVLSCIGIILGSFVAFLIGRILGRKVVEWIVGKETTIKYAKLLNDKGKFAFPLILILPVFPDDLVCMIAGITTMSMRFFLISVILLRPIGIIATCYIGSGELIPFSGWGLYVWPFIIIFLIFAFWFSYKYQPQIEKFFTDKIFKQNNNKDKK